jgi:hypothetical protein
MRGCKAFEAAQRPRVGMERMHMLKKQQRRLEAGEAGRSAADQFYALAA